MARFFNFATMDETRVRKIVADLMEDVVVAKPKDPVAYLIETLESSAKPLGDAELTRRLGRVLAADAANRTLAIAAEFPQHRRQVRAALEGSDGTLAGFKAAAAEALKGPAGPTSL